MAFDEQLFAADANAVADDGLWNGDQFERGFNLINDVRGFISLSQDVLSATSP